MPHARFDHARLAEIRRAIKRGRATDDGLIVAEGPHLLEDALRSEWQVHQVLCDSSARTRFAQLLGRADVPVNELSDREWRPLPDTEHSQGIVSLLEPRPWRFDDMLLPLPTLIVVLDGIQDPGNAGTIARSAEAFSAGGLIFTEGCVQVPNGKLLRAAAGSLFRIPYLERLSNSVVLQKLQHAGISPFALSGQDGMAISEAPFGEGCALVVGNEGAGVSATWKSAARMITIPTRGVESLNAGIACSIALFEALRKRAL